MANEMTLDWNSEINETENERFLLPDGDYQFTVENIDRAEFKGSAKIPPCKKIVLHLRVDTKEGTARFKTDLILCKTLEWKICSFFRSIGMKKQGEKLVMDWNSVSGKTGRAHVKMGSYVNASGETKEYNDIDVFYDSVKTEVQKPIEVFTSDALPF